MILLDVNLLLYAVNSEAPLHQTAKRWLETILSGDEMVGLPWNVLLAFVRLTTRPGLFAHPLRTVAAFDLVDQWLAQPSAVIVHPGVRHRQVLRSLLLPLGTGGNLVSDAHLAALAIECGAELCSCDRDFARFPGIRWRNPLT